MKLTYSLGLYDRDGDLYDSGIILWMDDSHAVRFSNLAALQEFATKLNSIIGQVEIEIDN